ncbi:hypothetical protein SOPP22_14990 [Shewanella sp. OPT22]|nr:hypothetical protein SOPP22_14990 [Shewanella sp. OPT22]
MLNHKRTLTIQDHEVVFKFNWLSGSLTIEHGNNRLFKTFIWKPFSKVKFEMFEQKFIIKALLVPINSFSLFTSDGSEVCTNLFPKLRRYSLVTFVFGLLKRTGLLLMAAFS